MSFLILFFVDGRTPRKCYIYIYCILDLTNSVREIGSSLATNSTFFNSVFSIFTKVILKFGLSLPVFIEKISQLLLFSHNKHIILKNFLNFQVTSSIMYCIIIKSK